MSSDAVPQPSTSQPQKQQTQRRLSLRLFLIRHGETESNVQKIVIGQSDSVRLMNQRVYNSPIHSFFNTPFHDHVFFMDDDSHSLSKA
jgi:hypothetical protein